TLEEFEPEKLRYSLERAGAAQSEIDDIVAQIEKVVHEGMPTEEIYKHAFALLRGTQVSVVARYTLRRALFGLGPTGFPFESFLARLFQTHGYKTQTGIIMNGKCAVHEIDLAAYKDDHSFVAEAKFHARIGIKSDLQVAMYSYARLLDLSEMKICSEDICGVKNLKIITNTKFTSAAIKYANCVGVDLLGWDYPKEANLYNLIEESKLYPITVLQGLNSRQKALLLEKNVVVCEDIVREPQKIKELGLSSGKMETLLSEARQLSSLQ
ncbi:MAG: ATPase, partial [Candidatus Paceibacterota bacterium]